MSFESFCNDLLKEYIDEFNEETIGFDLYFCDNMFTEYKELRPDLVSQNHLTEKTVNEYNGLVVPPNSLNGDFSVLINNEYFVKSLKANYHWIGTYIHEITHVYDYIKYQKIVKSESYDELFEYDKHRLFIMWTEYHAKVRGYYYVLKYSYDDIYDYSHTDFIFKQELPFLLNNLVDNYNSTQYADKQLYSVMHFLGHIAVWRKVYKNTFSEEILDAIFSENIWMKKLYYFFEENESLESIVENFDKMHNILSENFNL